MKLDLTIDLLCQEANEFALQESQHAEPTLYGITDGKAVGTYIEHKFQTYLLTKYTYKQGNSAIGIDFPDLQVDIKVTSINQPQSSCPFRSARQKIYGLGYGLLVFVYDKTDNFNTQTSHLYIKHVIYIAPHRTADFQTTQGIQKILANAGNIDDLMAFMQERFLPVDELEAQQIAEEIVRNPPEIGYLTISNALQWRLQYRRVIEQADHITGIKRVL